MRVSVSAKRALSAPVFMLIGLPSAVSVPLTEPAQNPTELGLYLAASVVSFVLVVAFALILSRVIGPRRIGLGYLVGLGLLLGALRGWSVWWLTDLAQLSQLDLVVRLITSSLLWALGLVIVGYLYEVISQSRSEIRSLRAKIERVRVEQDSLDQQRQWLANSQLEGLESELAESFVGLSQRLNDEGFGPGSYREIASELRSAARMNVRPRSIEMYGQPKKLIQILREAMVLTPTPWWIALAYLITAGGISLRIYGSSTVIAAPIAASLGIWLVLRLARRLPKAKHLAWLAATVLTGVTMTVVGADPTTVASRAIGAGLWSQSLILGFAVVTIAVETQRETKRQLETALNTSELDVQTLRMDIETQNIALAKYLHAILQTRLMSYAMQLERGEISQQQKQSLVALLTNPLREYQPATTSLEEGLAELRSQWDKLIAIHVDVQANQQKFDAATIQIVREAIANSARHGLAQEITVQIKDGQRRQIRIIDNGIGPRVGEAGMGTMVYNQLCRRWRLERNSLGGATLVAEL